ncbi:hypothetical protein RhiJN_24399 [Ceratobasidium sp. AG-Ba]|nr:hypothetical protein RhiJN_24399 [Ceratobasidium sp. AG-Ba]
MTAWIPQTSSPPQSSPAVKTPKLGPDLRFEVLHFYDVCVINVLTMDSLPKIELCFNKPLDSEHTPAVNFNYCNIEPDNSLMGFGKRGNQVDQRNLILRTTYPLTPIWETGACFSDLESLAYGTGAMREYRSANIAFV